MRRHCQSSIAGKGLKRLSLGLLCAVSGFAVGGHAAPVPIRFTLEQPGVVTLVIDDAEGNRIRNLISETPFGAGEHVVEWDGLDDHTPVQVDAQPVFRFEGEPVGPGRYVVRGIVRDEIALRYEMPFYTAGNPPWDTRDGRGAWLQDFGPAVAVASLPGEAPKMLIGSGVGEAFGIVWTDLAGQRLAGLRGVSAGGGWAGAELLAHDGGPQADAAVSAYVGNNWQGGFEIEAMRQSPPVGAYHNAVRTMSMALWGAGRKVYRSGEDSWLAGLAARDMTVVAAVGSRNKLIVIRDESKHNFGLRHGNPTVPANFSGTVVTEIDLASPRGLAITADGASLLAISGQRVVRFPFPRMDQPPVPVISEGLNDPRHIALDADGNIYISDPGVHQVHVFSPQGRRLRSIGEPGGPQRGPYNEQRMANPQGIAISADGRLWVAEASEFPRRISLWERDGRFVKALYGNANYGGGGMLDAGDRNRGYISQGGGALQLRLDWEKGESHVEKILWLPGEQTLPRLSYHIPYARVMGHAVYRGGRRFLSNAYSTAAGGGNHSDNTITLWREDDRGLPVLAASLGSANMWDVLKQPAFAGRWPEGLNPNSDFALYSWSDLNGNGQVDPEEVQIVANPEWRRLGNPNTFTLGEDLAIVDSLGNRYRPVRFTTAGTPVYDLEASDNIFPEARPTGTTGGGHVLDGGDGWAVTTWSPRTMPVGYVAGAWDGVVRWRYPARAIGNHAGYAVGAPAKPGELVALSSLAGRPFTPRGTEERLWSMVGLKGNVYLMTTDGLFVATLFRDYRQAQAGPDKAERGVALNHMTLGDDAWTTTLTQSSDGGVYIVGGHDSTWVTRVEGLESIRRLPNRVIEIKAPEARWLDAYKDGGFRHQITVAETAHLDRAMADVPVLVRLTPERFAFSRTTDDGSDIRFTDADGVTPLAFERVRHDAEEMVYWVRLPRLWKHGATFYLYSRRHAVSDASATAEMWPSAQYRLVLNMNEPASSDMLRDATPHGRHFGRGNRRPVADGWIGRAIGPGTSGDRRERLLGGSFTLSMWIKPTRHAGTLVGADMPGTSATYNITLTEDGRLKTWVHNSNHIEEMTSTSQIPLNEWTHVAHVYGGGQFLYVNGVQEASRGSQGVWGGGGRIFFGNFEGLTDAVRITEGALNAQRIKTEFLSEADALLKYNER